MDVDCLQSSSYLIPVGQYNVSLLVCTQAFHLVIPLASFFRLGNDNLPRELYGPLHLLRFPLV